MKTKNLFNHYRQILKEAAEEVPDPEEGFDTSGESGDVIDNPDDSVGSDVMPLTSEGENQYIADMIDAALFVPTSDDAATLTNLQSMMKMKKFKNAREEILPTILNLIRSQTEDSEIRDELNDV